MPASVIMDIAVVAVPAVCVWLGAKRGLFRSFAELAALLLALIVAAQAAEFGSRMLLEHVLRPAAANAIEQQVDAILAEKGLQIAPREELERAIGTISNESLRRQALLWLEEADLPQVISGRDALLEVAWQLADVLLDTAVRTLLYFILYLLCFIVLLFLLRAVIRVLNIPFRLPVLRELNWLGGLLFGACKGIILVYLLVTFLWRLQLVITPEVMEKSLLLPLLDQWIRFTGGSSVL